LRLPRPARKLRSHASAVPLAADGALQRYGLDRRRSQLHVQGRLNTRPLCLQAGRSNMKLFQTALAASLLGAGACGHAQPNPAAPPQATLAAGRIEGARSGDIVSYKGIPYAAPPLGELRWRAPQPVSSWNSARDATSYGDICPQTYNASDDGVGPLPMSEDCLTLNVFAPESAKAEPVMVWIHGGGFVNGSG